VIFDETTILNPRSHEDHDNKVEVHGVSKKVELGTKALKQKPEETHDEVTITESKYIFAKDRPRRQIKPLESYGDFVSFALNMEKSIDEQEPTSFHEAVNYDEAPQWNGA